MWARATATGSLPRGSLARRADPARVSGIIRAMKRSDFHFDLPPELIAQRPLARRGASRLLCLDGPSGRLEDRLFAALPDLLRPGDLLVFNDTRVMRARLFGRKESGGRLEILVERLLGPDQVLAHVRASKSPKPGGRLRLESGDALECLGREGELFRLRALDADFPALMERHGHMPLPPYIQRPDEVADLERYQTVYARRLGAVAAPTAGLHFDAEMLAAAGGPGGRLRRGHPARRRRHLPAGAGGGPGRAPHARGMAGGGRGGLRPGRADPRPGRPGGGGGHHQRAQPGDRRRAGAALAPYRGESRLFIRPGYRFRVVDAMITNFHLPESTLLMLVSAFSGYPAIMAAYRHAVAEGYRFFSYGDAMFLTRRD